jgi:hypothetical protein
LIRLWRIVGLVWDVKLPPNAAIIRACRLKKAPDNVKAA